MRKIEEQMINAIKGGYPWAKDNTAVALNTNGDVEVYLHGNHIATISDSSLNTVNIRTLKKYPTNTTKSRLRALGFNLYTKKGVIYLEGNAI